MTPNFPFVNREVKCAFRWYRQAALRNRNLRRCADYTEACKIWAINTPQTNFPPFQIYAGTNVMTGLATITSWKVYDLDGVEVLDLTSDSDKLRVASFDTFNYLVYDGDVLSQPLPMSTNDTLYESVIVTAATTPGDPTVGTYYSETFRVMCSSLSEETLTNTEMTSGFTGWTYGDWEGLVVEVETTPGDPSYADPNEGDQVINLGDDLLYTWTDGAWVSSTPDEDSYWSLADLGSAWHWFSGGEFLSPAEPPIEFFGAPDPIACWNGEAPVSISYTPYGITFPAVVQISATAFFGGGFTGALQVWVGGVLIETLTENGGQYDFDVLLSGSNTIDFVPTGGFNGCLTTFVGTAYGSSDECQYILEYFNCGDLGTQFYSDGWKNRIYFGNDVFISKPTPNPTEETDENNEGASVETFYRVQNTYDLYLGPIPWWFWDALSQVPGTDTVTLDDTGRVHGNFDSPDTLLNVSINGSWGNDTCLAPVTMTFSVDDAMVNSGCCDEFTPPCLSPCTTVFGFRTEEEPIEGAYYIDPDSNTYAEYIGFDNGPVDADGFGPDLPCNSGVVTGAGGFLDRYWDTDEWVRLGGFEFEYDTIGCDGPVSITVSGYMHPSYNARFQWSEDAIVWNDFAPDFTVSPDDLEAGVSIPITSGMALVIRSLRFVIFGNECDIGYSNVCDFNCTSMVVEQLGYKEGWTLADGGYFDQYADLAAMNAVIGTTDQVAFVIDIETFYYWDDGTADWVFTSQYLGGPLPPVIWQLFPARICVLTPLDAIQGTLSSPAVTTQEYQLQIRVTGTLRGQMHFPATFTYVYFDGPGLYSAIISPTIDTSQIYIDFTPEDGVGCITGLSVRPHCMDPE